MTMIQDEETVAVAQPATIGTGDIPLADRAPCPACAAGAEHQATVARQRDGALEIVILVCTRCAKDHPIWF